MTKDRENLRDFNENPGYVRNFASQLLACETDQVCRRHHGDIGKGENEAGVRGESIFGHGINQH